MKSLSIALVIIISNLSLANAASLNCTMKEEFKLIDEVSVKINAGKMTKTDMAFRDATVQVSSVDGKIDMFVETPGGTVMTSHENKIRAVAITQRLKYLEVVCEII